MITKPTLLLDEVKCRKNIAFMQDKAMRHEVELRPHFKTHQSLEIGGWFKDAGVNKITVSSVSMADYFSSQFEDITIAFPTNILEIEKIKELAGKVKLNLCIENVEALTYLSKHLDNPVHIYLKMDVGKHRTGISPVNNQLIEELLQIIEISTMMTFDGFLGHAGQTYSCIGEDAVNKVHQDSLRIMGELKSTYQDRYSELRVSLGDTPSCSLSEDFSGVDEIRPGNFAFYDLMQLQIGSCKIDQITVALACPIVAIHKDRSEIVVYGGGVHLSKDRLETPEGVIYGQPVEQTNNGWGEVVEGAYMNRISQEHGIITMPAESIDQYEVGDLLYILPVHSCMTADLMKEYFTLEGRKISMMSNQS